MKPVGKPTARRDPPPRSTAAGGPTTKDALHPRNRHRARYDFPRLIASSPGLRHFVSVNAYGDESVDFADPQAVKALNAAILKHFYGIAHWDIPEQFLCPPIPGRADYLHYAADLLGESNGGTIPRGRALRVLDIGVGANCVYPLIGHHDYGWSFIGSDTNPIALAAAQRIIDGNAGLAQAITLRHQAKPAQIFNGLITAAERFALSLCNPPFHASMQEAHAGTTRKLRNLAGTAVPKGRTDKAPVRNFGGQETELWCPGGEAAFVGRMITESARLPQSCLWFTSLIAKESNLRQVQATLASVKPQQTRIIAMSAGQKQSRIVAWTFIDQAQHRAWLNAHAGTGQSRPPA